MSTAAAARDVMSPGRPNLVVDKVRFAADLFRGTAGYYDLYRRPYPEAMIEDLVRRADVAECGRLLDLACGTGHLAFALRRWFGEVWAVDQEPDMVELVAAKAAAVGAEDIRPVVSSAESLDAEPDYFELVVIGNAFHRLDRDLVAGRVLRWLKPGGYLTLCWSSGPSAGEEDWQRVFAATLDKWQRALGAEDRVPGGWDLPRKRRPDLQLLADAGLEVAGRREFPVEHRWSLSELAGYVRSTSFLPAAVLGDQAAAFDADLADRLGPYGNGGSFTQNASCAYELARKPAWDPENATAAGLSDRCLLT
jgi:SAM-dependent methyltransferase